MNSKKQKVFVGISGGVDSSVSAYLLKKEGYDVHGIFVKTWSPDWLPCTWVDEKRDAMRVCAALDIPFHFLDAEEEYKKGVADYMISEYRRGRTPNPDVLCNRVIKFGVMWDYARAHGADYIATGHYAQTNGAHLIKGVDPKKDQAYFLWMLTPEDLSHTLFPIGYLTKDDVRAVATTAGLFTSDKKDSQGICFLGDVDMRDFLSHYIEQKTGPVMTQDGSVVGEHDGVWFYTLGERHGFRITEHSTQQKPYYIVEKDIEHNTLVVSQTPIIENNEKTTHTLLLRDSTLSEKMVDPKKIVTAQIRYHGEFLPAIVQTPTTVVLLQNTIVALGQSVVLYDGTTILGGGIVDEAK